MSAERHAVDATSRVLYRPLRRGNALEDAIARLVQTIRLEAVAPGQSLPPERELAALFGISRDTVREAIKELSDAGYLVSRRGRYGGTFVAETLPETGAGQDAADLGDLLGMRRVLEVGAARAAATRRLDRDATQAVWDHHLRALAAGVDDYRRPDTLFHLAVAEAAGIPSLVELVAENRARVNACLDAFPLLPGNIVHSGEQHARIAQAIIDGDPDAADAAMRDHLDGSEALIRGFLG